VAQCRVDQLIAFGGDNLTAEGVHSLLGTTHEEHVAEIASAIFARDAKRALAIIGGIVDKGQQLGELLDQLIDYWRDLMVVQCAGLEGQVLSVSSKFRAALKKQADAVTADTILAGLDVLATAKTRLRFTAHARIVLEIALVRLCQLDNLVSLSQLAQWLGKDGAAASTGPANTDSRPMAVGSPPGSVEKKKVEDEVPAAGGQLPVRAENLPAIRQQLLVQAGLTIGSELRRVSGLAISGPNSLVLQVP